LALSWFQSDDPLLRDPEYSGLVPGAIENYTAQLHELESRKEATTEPVRVGLGTAKLTQKVLGGRNG